MFGAIAGDITGSIYEFHPIKDADFPFLDQRGFYTDDTVLTVATAVAILDSISRGSATAYGAVYKEYGRRYPNHSWGHNFAGWLFSDSVEPYGSYGNGSAMRVSPVGWAYDSLDDVLVQAEASAAVTHNHPEGIKGAQATAAAIFLARRGTDQDGPGNDVTRSTIREEIEARFGYDLGESVHSIRTHYSFHVSCQMTVPQAITCALESDSVEHAIRNAVSLGGDADTLGCIAGAIAEALHGGVGPDIAGFVQGKLPPEMWEVLEEFQATFHRPPV